MKTKALFTALLLAALTTASLTQADTPTPPATQPAETTAQITITAGHDTVGQDRGRPIILIAAALGVPPETFRTAFSKVHPANTNVGPTRAEAQQNKHALLAVLAPLGITNERLDEVSNYYRYNRPAGDLWKHTEATAIANIQNGKVISITITNPGAGYSSPPELSLPNFPNLKLTPTLTYTKDLKTNGNLAKIEFSQ